MSLLGQSRHIQRTPKTNFVRYAPNSDHSAAEFVCRLSARSHRPWRFLHVNKRSFGIGKIWRMRFERGAKDMVPRAGRHAEITAMG